ncbi:hypothetical protein H0H92_006786 [Tricholoma furcatifolium]|nr:hypothetical protein H0H92_006786 [Tricholoma furcatifolium]
MHPHHGGHGGHSHGNNANTSTVVNDSDSIHLRDYTNIHAQHNHTLDPPVNAPQHNLNLVGVLVHLFGDAINNVAVIIAATLIWKLQSPQRFYVDPTVSLVISLIIFGSAVPMTIKSGRILLEATPTYLDLEKIKDDLLSFPEVLSVHDLHVWHLSQAVILASLHVCVPVNFTLGDWEQTERSLQQCFSAYGINHVTISPEIQRGGQEELHWNEPSNCRLPSQDEFGCAVSDLKRRNRGHA